MSNRRLGVQVAALVVACLVPRSVPAQEAELGTVLARAGTYVTEFRRQLSGVVAEESYSQRARTGVGNAFRGFPQYREQSRSLRSDFLLVRPDGVNRYLEFRDVFEVDGRAVRDRQERLTRLFLDGSASAAQQIGQITIESARYNIGDIERTLNTPTLALLFLRPEYQPRVRFARVTDIDPRLELELDASLDLADTWVIEYHENQENTLISGTDGRDLPAYGRFWIEPATGRVLVTEFIIDDPEVRATIDVRYESDSLIGLFVPIEMREHYQDVRGGSRVDGAATYSKFRQFQVQVEENPVEENPPAPN